MAFSKAILFDPDRFNQSFWSKAFAHPARIIILTYLLENGTTSFHIIAKLIPLARPTVSQHFRFLRKAGLVTAEDIYPHTYYQLSNKLCKKLAARMIAMETSFAKSA